jgi:drug/metabolite transporter (DMT)-like permease
MGLDPMAVTTGQLTAGAIVMLPIAFIVDRPWTHAFPGVGPLAAISALALLCTAFAYVLYFRLIAHAGATNALLVTLLVPPTAIVLGALFLGEALAPQDFLGLGLIALGLAAIDGRLLTYLRPARIRREA